MLAFRSLLIALFHRISNILFCVICIVLRWLILFFAFGNIFAIICCHGVNCRFLFLFLLIILILVDILLHLTAILCTLLSDLVSVCIYEMLFNEFLFILYAELLDAILLLCLFVFDWLEFYLSFLLFHLLELFLVFVNEAARSSLPRTLSLYWFE